MNRYVLRQLSELVFYFDVQEIESIQYKIEFNAASYLLPANLVEHGVYEVSFSRINNKQKITDEISINISNTICFAIQRFIENHNCPIVFMCDSNDNKHSFRLRLFGRWFNNSDEDKLYTFTPKRLYSEELDFEMYAGMIVPTSHPGLDELISEFDNPAIFRDNK